MKYDTYKDEIKNFVHHVYDEKKKATHITRQNETKLMNSVCLLVLLRDPCREKKSRGTTKEMRRNGRFLHIRESEMVFRYVKRSASLRRKKSKVSFHIMGTLVSEVFVRYHT